MRRAARLVPCLADVISVADACAATRPGSAAPCLAALLHGLSPHAHPPSQASPGAAPRRAAATGAAAAAGAHPAAAAAAADGPAPRAPPAASEAEFHAAADAALERLADALEALADEALPPDADVELSQGVLTLRLGGGLGTYVLNKQTPNRQIWMSSPVSGPVRYDRHGGLWVYARDGHALHARLEAELRELTGADVDLNPCADCERLNVCGACDTYCLRAGGEGGGFAAGGRGGGGGGGSGEAPT